MTKKNVLFYGLVVLVFFSGEFLVSRGMVTGTPPALAAKTITGESVVNRIASGQGLIYFWAHWCGVCRMMQEPVSQVLKDYPGVTVALKSGTEDSVKRYLNDQGLDWPVVNDARGTIGDRYGVRGVPAVFVLNPEGNIVFTSSGYSTELGLRIRLWLAGFF